MIGSIHVDKSNAGATFLVKKNPIITTRQGSVGGFDERYEGMWKDRMYHGKGTYKFGDGSTYDGFWREGRFDGKGILDMSGSSGDYYDGEFKKGLRHGFGSYYHENGDLYEGQWEFGEKSGHGVSLLYLILKYYYYLFIHI